MKRIKEWLRKHRKGIAIVGILLVAAGIIVVCVINGKKIKIPLPILAEAAPELLPAVEKASETVAVNADIMRLLIFTSKAMKPECALQRIMPLHMAHGQVVINRWMAKRHVCGGFGRPAAVRSMRSL